MNINCRIKTNKLICLFVYGKRTFVAQPRLVADNISLFCLCVSLSVRWLPLTFLHFMPCQKKQEQAPPSWRQRDVCKYGETCSHLALAALHLLLLPLSLVASIHKCARGQKRNFNRFPWIFISISSLILIKSRFWPCLSNFCLDVLWYVSWSSPKWNLLSFCCI